MAGKFTLQKSRNGKFHFNLIAANGKNILTSEIYETKSAAKNGIRSVGKNCTNDSRFKRRESKNGKLYFALKAANGLEIGRSQMYKSVSGLENGIRSVKTNAPMAEVVDITNA